MDDLNALDTIDRARKAVSDRALVLKLADSAGAWNR